MIYSEEVYDGKQPFETHTDHLVCSWQPLGGRNCFTPGTPIRKKTRRDIVHLGKIAKNKAEALQLQLCHACEDWTDKVMEEVQEGLGRSRQWTEKTQQGVFQALDSAKDFVQKEIRSVLKAQG